MTTQTCRAEAAASWRFSANGLVYASAWDAPGMRPAPPGAAPDVTVLPGEVRSDRIADAPLAGDCRLPSPGVAVIEDAAFLARIEDGRRVTLDLRPGFGPGLTRLLIGYGASSVLLHQRGGLPLHAAAAASAEGAILFVGPAGAGKSTFAAALARRGWALIGDDLIAAEDAPRPALHPAIRTVKLWQDSAAALGAARLGAAVAAEGTNKEVLALPPAPAEPDWPAPIRAVIALDWLHPPDAAPEVERLSPLEALPRLREAIHRPALASALGRDAELLARLARIAAATPCFLLKRPRGFDRMEAAAEIAVACAATGAPA